MSKRVSSRQHSIVASYRAAARGDARDVVLLDGVHLVSEAVAAQIRIAHAAVTTDAMKITEVGRLIDALTRAGVDLAIVSATVMDALSPVKSSSSVVALAERPSIQAQAFYRRPRPLVVVAVDVQDPGNIGAIVRVAEAGGASGIVAAGISADPFGWKALRGSMGSALRLPILVQPDGERAVAEVRRHGCRVFATVPRDGRPLFEVTIARPAAILIGGEGPGLPASLVSGADERVTIPMQSPVESLNAAVTAALLIYRAAEGHGSAVS